MKINAYTIYDSAIKAYNSPFFMQTDALAKRVFMDQVNNPESQISKSPQDFTLYNIGVYDDQNGMFVPGKVMSLGNGKEYQQQIDKQNNDIIIEAIRKVIIEEMQK